MDVKTKPLWVSSVPGVKNKSKLKAWNCVGFTTEWLKCCRSIGHLRGELLWSILSVWETGPLSSALAASCSQHTQAHGCCCNSAEESHHAEGGSKVKQKFLIKDVSWKGVVVAGTLEDNCVKKSNKPDGDERLLQESPFPTRHHYFSQ